MGTFIDIRGPFKGRIKKKVEPPPQGTVRTIDPKPIWVGMKEGSGIKRLMPTDEAQNWVQGGVDRSVKLYIKKRELDEL